jgi:hypothetical protein
MQILLLTFVAMGFFMAIMAVGVIFSNRALRGSCGGPSILDPDGDPIACGDCNCRLPEPEQFEVS